MAPLLSVQGAAFGYDSQDVFRGLSLDVDRGEIYCIVGPNGCGKTTLLDCILGLLRPRAGQIMLGGRSLERMRASEVARQVAYVPQYHEKAFPYTVLQVVLMGRVAHTSLFGSPSARDHEVALDALDTVGLVHLQERPYTRLSGGEVQLLMIARALAQQAPLMVMDEPTAHLDFKHELVIMETVAQLVKEAGLSVIMATHVPNHAFYYENLGISTSVALMNNQGFAKVGSPTDVLTEENLKALYQINARVVTYRDNGLDSRQIIPVSTLPDVSDVRKKENEAL